MMEIIGVILLLVVKVRQCLWLVVFSGMLKWFMGGMILMFCFGIKDLLVQFENSLFGMCLMVMCNCFFWVVVQIEQEWCNFLFLICECSVRCWFCWQENVFCNLGGMVKEIMMVLCVFCFMFEMVSGQNLFMILCFGFGILSVV